MAKELFARAAIVLSLVVFGPPRAALAAPPEPTISLELDARLLDPEVGARIEAQLGEQLPARLSELGYAPALDPSSATSTLRIRVIAFDTDQRDYEVQVQLLGPEGEPVEALIRCDACSESRLVSRILADAPTLLEDRVEAREVEEREPLPLPVPLAEDSVKPRKVWPIGALGISGAVAAVAGIAVAVVGLERLDRGEVKTRLVNQTWVFRDFQPAGATMLALGITSTLVGVALVAVDVKRRSSINQRFGLDLGRSHFGLQFEQRF